MSELSPKTGTSVLGENQRQDQFENIVVSDGDLDTLLEDVEKIQAGRRLRGTDVKFTKEDERDLEEIFNDAEQRQKEFDELRVAVRQNSESDDDDRSSNSNSSKSSQDSDLDRLIDEVELDEETKRGISKLNKEMEDEMDQILAQADGGKSKKKQQAAKTSLKKRQNSSSSESSDYNHSSDDSTKGSEEELNSMVAELLEF